MHLHQVCPCLHAMLMQRINGKALHVCLSFVTAPGAARVHGHLEHALACSLAWDTTKSAVAPAE